MYGNKAKLKRPSLALLPYTSVRFFLYESSLKQSNLFENFRKSKGSDSMEDLNAKIMNDTERRISNLTKSPKGKIFSFKFIKLIFEI